MPAIDAVTTGRSRTLLGLALCGWLGASAPSARAFPPAPFHTIYGVARNEFGQPLEGAGIRVVLESAAGRPIASAVGWVSISGANYAIRVPMDTGLFDAPYQPTALRPTTAFRIRVLVGTTVLLPIEMQGDMKQLGKPGERTRIDLTLGEDTDGDGIPDAWERHLMAMLGLTGLDAVRPGDDLDHDGLTNLQEYIAGSYAFDPVDGFRLDILEKAPEGPVMEFLAIRGRTYTVESSADMAAWSPQAFRVAGDASQRTSYRATDTRAVRVVAVVPAGGAGFFRLKTQ